MPTNHDSAPDSGDSADSLTHGTPIPPEALWLALSKTPGVGVSITDSEGRLLFVNDTSMVLFSQHTGIDYHGKRISDFHPPEFVAERLALIRRVLDENKPLSIRHLYHGRRIESIVWPIKDKAPPFNRALVVSREVTPTNLPTVLSETIETVSTHYIDLGPLDVLTRRELEVLALLGQGLSVPQVATVLHRSPKTIQRHKAAISGKLNLSGQAEMVSIATSLGLQVEDAKLSRLGKQASENRAG